MWERDRDEGYTRWNDKRKKRKIVIGKSKLECDAVSCQTNETGTYPHRGKGQKL